MKTLNQELYERYKSDKAVKIITKFGSYKLNFIGIANTFCLIIAEKPITYLNSQKSIFIQESKPYMNGVLLEQFQGRLEIKHEKAKFLIDRGSFNNSYSFTLRWDKIERIIYIELNEKPCYGYENIIEDILPFNYNLK